MENEIAAWEEGSVLRIRLLGAEMARFNPREAAIIRHAQWSLREAAIFPTSRDVVATFGFTSEQIVKNNWRSIFRKAGLWGEHHLVAFLRLPGDPEILTIPLLDLPPTSAPWNDGERRVIRCVRHYFCRRLSVPSWTLVAEICGYNGPQSARNRLADIGGKMPLVSSIWQLPLIKV